MTQAMLPQILALRQQGKSLSEIGRLLGFTHQAIGRALEACLSTLENT
jgi:transcriptional regulator